MSKLEVTNPQNGERLAVLEKASLEEIVSLVAEAKEAQKEWGRKSMYARSQVLYRFLELYRERTEEIAKIISLEITCTARYCQTVIRITKKIWFLQNGCRSV